MTTAHVEKFAELVAKDPALLAKLGLDKVNADAAELVTLLQEALGLDKCLESLLDSSASQKKKKNNKRLPLKEATSIQVEARTGTRGRDRASLVRG